MNAIQAWLDALTEPIPLNFRPEHDPHGVELAKSLREALEESGASLGGSLEALLYLRIGLMEPAHGIVQDAKRGIDAYIHGVVHRMEGDYWNAKYWFDRVADPRLIDRIGSHIRQSLSGNWTGPEDFVDACKTFSVAKREELIRLATEEWEALWQIVHEKNPR